jgi:DNA-directed RNA polymerase specialized sigma24 family protein
MDNPAGYLYRVGQSKARRSLGRSRRVVLPPVLPAEESAWVEPGLPEALGRLPVKQRAAVMLTHGYGWTQAEVAKLFGVSRTTVQGHVERGLIKLRRALGVQVGS